MTDSTGAALPDARVVLRDVATGQEVRGQTGADGRYELTMPAAGTYLVDRDPAVVRRSRAHRRARRRRRVARGPGARSSSASLTTRGQRHGGARRARDPADSAARRDACGAAAIEQANPLSTGDALATSANITPVGNGPFGVRPRLRGLDSTRLLVLVDGERLNTARQATDRTGAEVGLISHRRDQPHGDRQRRRHAALRLRRAGRHDQHHHQRADASRRRTQWLYGFNGFYSSNEDGRRGTATLGVTAPRYAVRVQGGAEDFDNYTAGELDVEDTRPFFASGQLDRADTIDDNFGFTFNAFPDPFNAPYVRTDNDGAELAGRRATSSTPSGLVKLGEQPDGCACATSSGAWRTSASPTSPTPYFFNATSLPHSNLDKVSARYEAQAVTPWLANLSLTAYYQRTERLLQNTAAGAVPGAHRRSRSSRSA